MAYDRGRTNQAVWWLMGAALSLRFAVIGLDPFLHDWDERFHALVAKNMLADPWHPMLRAVPLLPYDFQQWCCNHTWLHKQPLFLWQLALSLKLFGVNELALRIPSTLLGSLLIWPVYRIGRLIVSPSVGYAAAVLLAFAYYPIELTTGWQSVDHADVSFSVYTVSSIWAYSESQQSNARTLGWCVVVGLLAGAAVLCKWLPGLVIYACWGVDLLLRHFRNQPRGNYWHAALALLLTTLMVMPWQLYSHFRFPLESTFEHYYNTQHFSHVLEGKGGPWYFYLTKNMWYQYQWLVLGIAGGFALFRVAAYRSRPWRPLLLSCGLIFGFFSLAATKMPSYTYVVGPLLLVVAAAAIVPLVTYVRAYSTRLAATFILLVVLLDLRPVSLLKHHSTWFATESGLAERQRKLQHTAVYRQLDALVPARYVVFNAPPLEDIEAMFYSHRNVYSGWPTKTEYVSLQARGVGIAMLAGQQPLPDYLAGPDILLVPLKLK